MTSRRYIDWVITTPTMLLSTVMFMRYQEVKEQDKLEDTPVRTMEFLINILIILVVSSIVINVVAITLAKRGLTKDENNNLIPDILEEKFAEMKSDVSNKVDRVGEELKDVSNALKQVGNQLGDIPKAVSGNKRSGRRPKK